MRVRWSGRSDGIAARLRDLVGFGLLEDAGAVLGRIGTPKDLAEALDGATYVQESTPERVEVKREVFADLDRLARRMRCWRARPRAFRHRRSPSTWPGGGAASWRIRSTRPS